MAAVLIEPLTATVLAAVVSDEPLAGTRPVGGALVIASIAVRRIGESQR